MKHSSMEVSYDKTFVILKRPEHNIIPGVAYEISIITKSADDHQDEKFSAPAKLFGLVRPLPISQLESVAGRMSSRSLMFQWNPSQGG